MSLKPVLSAALVAACLFSVTVGDILIGPLNDAAVAGDSLSIACQWTTYGNERTQFVEYTTNALGAIISDGGILLPGHPNNARYTLTADNVTGLQTLTINPTINGDGGTYECRDSGVAGQYRRSRIIILASNANFTTTLPTNRVVLLDTYYTSECRTTYTGSVAPFVSWTGPPPFQQIYTNSTTQAWSGMAFTATKSQDAQSFNCRTNFTADQFLTIDENMATNVPGYSYTTGTGIIFVQWAPYNLTYYPQQPTYEIGQVLTCWADGFPTVSYTWINVITQEQFPAQTLTLTPAFVGLSAMRCQARNSIGTTDLFVNITVNPITTTTTPPPTTPTTTVAPIAPCDSINGRWEYTRPDGTTIALCFFYDPYYQSLYGLVQNTTNDDFATDSVGLARQPTFSDFAVSTLYAVSGVGAFAGECRKCYGVEHMIVNGISRKSEDAFFCNEGSELISSPSMTFFRVPTRPPCPSTTSEWQAHISKMRAAGRGV